MTKRMLRKRRKTMIKPSHEGELHEELGVPAGQKIGKAKLASAANSPSAKVRKQAIFAENMNK